jgi:hypothetical protein
MAGCSGGGSSPTTTTAAPANLAYPQAAITATAGQPISADTPTVNGTVTTYSVAPALPAGLSLNTTTGAITGTPTAVASQGSYVITASNPSGTTTATVQITVNAAVVPPDSATGSPIATVPLPELLTFQPVNSSSLYTPALNTIFALPSGNTLYTSSTPASGQGAVVGSNVVFTSGARIVVDTR